MKNNRNRVYRVASGGKLVLTVGGGMTAHPAWSEHVGAPVPTRADAAAILRELRRRGPVARAIGRPF